MGRKKILGKISQRFSPSAFAILTGIPISASHMRLLFKLKDLSPDRKARRSLEEEGSTVEAGVGMALFK